ARYTVEWGRARRGGLEPLPRSGAVIFAGDRVYVRVTNDARDALYVSIYDIGASGRVSLLSGSEPSGVELATREDYTLGADHFGAVEGLEFWWPRDVPADGPRLETLLVFLSDRPHDLRALETPGVRSLTRAPLRGESPSAAARAGSSRDHATGELRYAVESIDFFVHPEPARLRDDGRFLLDERPDASFLATPPPRARRPPAGVHVRLLELTLRDGHAWSLEPARVDALVITADAGRCVYSSSATLSTTQTPRALVNASLYTGAARHLLDLAVWITLDRPGPSFSQIVEEQLATDEARAAIAALRELASERDPPHALVRASSAASTLVRGISERLDRSRGSLGVYRTWLIGQNAFEIGRHPRRGALDGDGVSLAYRVVRASVPPP
ncbi:MAG: hypothetical protein KC468_26605, partial [Myxococcales bacterium]|nr:hypothetical protein [Myxococcales bacterium]